MLIIIVLFLNLDAKLLLLSNIKSVKHFVVERFKIPKYKFKS